MTGTANQA
jgi:hypothetical protein